MKDKNFAAGASASLNRTITDLMSFLDDDDRGRGKLRTVLEQKLADFGQHWYQRGIRQGYRKCAREVAVTGAVPKRLPISTKREFFPGQELEVRMRARLRPNRKVSGRATERARTKSASSSAS